MSLFANAKAVETAKPKAAKSKKQEINIAGLNNLAAIDAVINSLTTLRETFEADVKGQMREHFIEAGEAIGKRPVNFRGIDENASASCEIKRRNSRSVLNDAEVELLEKNKIPYDVIEDSPECFIINPEYSNDEGLLGKVSSVLEKHVKDLPKDFIQKQAGKRRTVVTDESIDAVFKNKVAGQLMDVVTTLAVKPSLNDDDVGKALAQIAELIA